MAEDKTTRRDFMAKTAAGAAGVALTTMTVAAQDQVAGANDRLSLGIVGPGGAGAV